MGIMPPPLSALLKRKTPIMGRLNEMKSGWHNVHHTAPSSSIENPPLLLGGIIQLECGSMWIFTPPYSCCYWKESPKNDKGG